MTLLSFETTLEEGVAVVSLEGELDVSGASLLEDELARVGAEAPAGIVLDLTKLEFMDSTGLRLVVLTESRSRQEGRPVVLVRGPEAVQRVFEVTRMDDRLSFADSPAEAVAAVRGGEA